MVQNKTRQVQVDGTDHELKKGNEDVTDVQRRRQQQQHSVDDI